MARGIGAGMAVAVGLWLGEALATEAVPEVEVAVFRVGHSEAQRASFATVSATNRGERSLRLITVQCWFRRDEGQNDMTALLFRDLDHGESARAFTYSHGARPAREVDCRAVRVRE